MPEFVQISEDRGIVVLTLDRPKVLNAIDAGMRREIIAALQRFNADSAARALVVTGSGSRAFSAGQDLAEARAQTAETVAAWNGLSRECFQAFRQLDKPVVAALNGLAAGAGFQISLLCDLRIGHSRVRMSQPEIRAGLPSVIGSALMEMAIGRLHMIDLSLTGRFVEADEALRIGLLNRIVAADAVLETAKDLAAELAAQPPLAFRLTKRALRESTQARFDAAFEAAVALQSESYAAGEPQAVMDAFLARRRNKNG